MSILLPSGVACSVGSPFSQLTLAGKEVFLQSPGPGVRIVAFTEYTRSTGMDLVCYAYEQSRSDTADIAFRRFSGDNGRTWTCPSSRVDLARGRSGE